MLDQELIGFVTQVVGRSMERGIVICGFHCMHISPAIKEQLDRLDTTDARSYHESRRSPATASRGRHVFQQEANNVCIVMSTCSNKGILSRLSLQDETTINQKSHNVCMTSLDRTPHRTPTKISGVITLCLNRYSLFNQTPHDINPALIASVTQVVSIVLIIVILIIIVVIHETSIEPLMQIV